MKMKTNFFGRRRVVNASVHWIQPNIKRYQVSVIIGNNNNNHVNGESNDNNGKNLKYTIRSNISSSSKVRRNNNQCQRAINHMNDGDDINNNKERQNR